MESLVKISPDLSKIFDKNLTGGPIQYDCWRIVWFFVDTSAISALRLANLESLRGRSGTRPCTAGVEFDGPDSIEPSAETFWLCARKTPLHPERYCPHARIRVFHHSG